jgi:quercetin dioxygenase-like cupin family protein
MYSVEAGQLFVAEPGSAHRAHNADDATEDVRVVGMGAPPVSDGHSYEE